MINKIRILLKKIRISLMLMFGIIKLGFRIGIRTFKFFRSSNKKEEEEKEE